MSFKEVIKSESNSRAGYKARITITLKDLAEKLNSHILSKDLFEREENKVLKWLDKIENVNTQIGDFF